MTHEEQLAHIAQIRDTWERQVFAWALTAIQADRAARTGDEREAHRLRREAQRQIRQCYRTIRQLRLIPMAEEERGTPGGEEEETRAAGSHAE